MFFISTRLAAFIMEAMLILDAYGNGGFQRQHSVTDLIILAPQYLATAALWPLLIVILTLVYFGVLPAGIRDL